ncbi:hypothetical protein KL942_005380 [Ogataea angusta]|uniref:Major facilitator superfamily (MFS) profile domain-containing protein n=1 Tax=Pichia angusta TaxID=870730 RepID=A0ABQ7RPF7_PICAN|nr:hypothetical protein KL942_005380 [Ogataea angusta]KAG7845032.1 hypothetical protein KL940_005357 [Ogataea angusta]
MPENSNSVKLSDATLFNVIAEDCVPEHAVGAFRRLCALCTYEFHRAPAQRGITMPVSCYPFYFYLRSSVLLFNMKRVAFSEQVSGFPKLQVGILLLIQVAQYTAELSTDCYIWHIIKSFHTAKAHDEVLKYIGYLAFADGAPQVLTYIFWAFQAERFGRKPIMLTGLISLAFSMLLYGFGRKFYLIWIAKFAASLLNANHTLVRTALGEVTPSLNHQPLAFLTIPVSYFVGSWLGPLIGNNLITPWTGPPPADAPPDRRFIKVFPFALPNIVLAIILLSTALLTFLFFEETHPYLDHQADRGLAFGNLIREKLGLSSSKGSYSRKFATANDGLVDGEDDIELQDPTGAAEDSSAPVFATYSRPKLIQMIISHTLFGYLSAVFAKLADSYFTESLNKDSIGFPFMFKGGCGISWVDLPVIVIRCLVVAIIITVIAVPLAAKYGAILGGYRVSLTSFIVTFFFLPFFVFVAPDVTGIPQSAYYGFLYVLLLAQNTFFLIGLAFAATLLNMHVSAEDRNIQTAIAMAAYAGMGYFGTMLTSWMRSLFNNLGLQTIFWWLLALISLFTLLHSRVIAN